MPSAFIGRSTGASSVSLEEKFWNGLQEMERTETLSGSGNAINRDRQHSNLCSTVRLFVLGFYRDRVSH
jgi:predicted DNA-binding ribbon-helix-helix protein